MLPQFIESSNSSSGAEAELSWPERTQENDSSRLSYDYWAEKMQQSEEKKILHIFKEYLEKKHLYYETVPRNQKISSGNFTRR